MLHTNSGDLASMTFTIYAPLIVCERRKLITYSQESINESSERAKDFGITTTIYFLDSLKYDVRNMKIVNNF
jgi:hypothetical protein